MNPLPVPLAPPPPPINCAELFEGLATTLPDNNEYSLPLLLSSYPVTSAELFEKLPDSNEPPACTIIPFPRLLSTVQTSLESYWNRTNRFSYLHPDSCTDLSEESEG